MFRVLRLFCLLSLPAAAGAAHFNHASYSDVLQRYVNEDGRVDYEGIRQNSLTTLEVYLGRAGDADLGGWTYQERLAFWINIYNARVLLLVAERPELKKISEDFEMFNKPFTVAGGTYSLNDIEYCILLGRLNPDTKRKPIENVTLPKIDPRIHFALVCGAKGCPPLRNSAYADDTVESTLRTNAVRFANDSRYVDIENGRLKLSTLLKWNSRDFAPLGGVGSYLAGLIDVERTFNAERIQKALLKDLPSAIYHYDWTVNAQFQTE
jgi:hypothetical protein